MLLDALEFFKLAAQNGEEIPNVAVVSEIITEIFIF